MIRMGIIGGGFIGNEHIVGLQKAGAEIVALAEPLDETRESVRKRRHIPDVYADGLELIAQSDVDAVSVCSPNSLHKRHAIAALEAGKHALCEKPMAMNRQESIDMVRAARRNGRLLMMGFNQMFDSGITKIRELERRGFFGEIYHARTTQIRQHGNPTGAGSWFLDKTLAGGGVSFDLACHAFYRCWYAMGKPRPVAVSGQVFQKFVAGSVDDFAAAFVKLEGGKTMLLEASWNALRPDEGKRTLVMGTRAGAAFHREKNELTLIRHEGDSVREEQAVLDGEDFPNRYDHFVDCIENGTTCLCPGEDGHVTQSVLDAILLSSETGEEVRIELDPEIAGRVDFA